MYTVMKLFILVFLIPILNGCITDMQGRTLFGAMATGMQESFDPTRARGFSNADERRTQAHLDGQSIQQAFPSWRYDHRHLYAKHIASRPPKPYDVNVRRYSNGVKVSSWSSWSAGQPDFWQTLQYWDEEERRFRSYRSRSEYLNINPPQGGP